MTAKDKLRELIENGVIPFLDGTERNISTAKYLINIGHSDLRLRPSFDKNYEMSDKELDDFLDFLYTLYFVYQKEIIFVHFFGMDGEFPIPSISEDDAENILKELEETQGIS